MRRRMALAYANLFAANALFFLWMAANVPGPLGVWSGFFAVICVIGCGAEAQKLL